MDGDDARGLRAARDPGGAGRGPTGSPRSTSTRPPATRRRRSAPRTCTTSSRSSRARSRRPSARSTRRSAPWAARPMGGAGTGAGRRAAAGTAPLAAGRGARRSCPRRARPPARAGTSTGVMGGAGPPPTHRRASMRAAPAGGAVGPAGRGAADRARRAADRRRRTHRRGRTGAAVPAAAGVPAEDFGDALLLPGLVNTHTHLELTGFDGRVPEPRFPRLDPPGSRAQGGPRSPRRSWRPRAGASRDCWAAGVTTVADTGDSGAVIEALAEAGGSGIAYQEVFGPHPDQLDGEPRRAAAGGGAAAAGSPAGGCGSACRPTRRTP